VFTLVACRTSGSLGSCSKLLSHRPRNISNHAFGCKGYFYFFFTFFSEGLLGGILRVCRLHTKKVSGTKQEAST